jgi:hypothetical protein
VLFSLGWVDLDITREMDAHVIDSMRALSEDEKVLLNILEHVSSYKGLVS